MSASTRLVDRETVARLLRMEDCIAEMERTLIEVSAGQSVNLQRQMIPQPEGNMFAIMGSALTAQSLVGSKVIVFPGQKAKENGTSQGIVPLFDGSTGALLAVVDGEGITGVRTAATSAAATKALARADASALAILGAGRLGRLHIEAICSVRPIATVYVWDIAPAAIESCCAWAEQTFGIKAVPCKTAKEAVVPADIVCTVTQSAQPVLLGEWMKPGAHVNAVGACAPHVREVDTAAVCRARVFLDWTEAALRDTGDLVIPVQEGAWSPEDAAGEIGRGLAGELPGRRDEGEITLFESVGIAVEDLAAAALVYRLAEEQDLGTLASW